MFFTPPPPIFSSHSRNKDSCVRNSDRKKKKTNPVQGTNESPIRSPPDAFMEVLHPRVGEHEASLCKWVCRVRANEIYQSRCCNCGRQGFHSAREELEYVSGEVFLPADDVCFAYEKSKKNNIWKHQAAVEDFWWLFMRWTESELMKCFTPIARLTDDCLSESCSTVEFSFPIYAFCVIKNKAHHTNLAVSYRWAVTPMFCSVGC